MTRPRRMAWVLGIASLVVSAAPAQARDVSGTVKAVDPVAGIVYFSDGRMVHLEPAAEIYVNGRKMTLREIRAGNQVDIRGGAAERTAAALPGHPPVDAMGTVTSIDRQAGTVTLGDGRVLKITDRTTFWQRAGTDRLRPGTQVFIDDAKPVAFKEAGKAEMKADESMRMGTVAFIDPQNKLIVLTDGTRVRMAPAAVIRFNGQRVAVTELTPGSEVVVRIRPAQAEPQPAASPVTGDTTIRPDAAGSRGTDASGDASALATRRYAEFESDEVLLVRRPQAP